MTETESPETAPESTEPPKPRARGGRRRGGRGGRSKPDTSEAEAQTTDSEAKPQSAEADGGRSTSRSTSSRPRKTSPAKTGRATGNRDLKAIHRQVQGIIDSLHRSLEEMEAAQRLLAQIATEREEDMKELADLRETLEQFQKRRQETRSRSTRRGS